jgi:hypothetical protein
MMTTRYDNNALFVCFRSRGGRLDRENRSKTALGPNWVQGLLCPRFVRMQKSR